MVSSMQVTFFFDLAWLLNLCSFDLHHIAFIQQANGTCPSIQVSKAIIFKTNCYFTDIIFFIFISSKQQDNLSLLNISMIIDKKPMERYRAVLKTQRINGDSFELKIESLDETKVKMINLLFNIISNSDINSVCLKCLKN